ncbi:MAG: PTS IIA-like nitrogen regulatory protein PtsN [Gammaproteobacteria bacterium]
MKIEDILLPARIACRADVTSKKSVLELLAKLIADNTTELSEAEVFESLFARERLGSTGLGHGVAIPHGRLKGSSETRGAFVQLARGIDYDAVDQQPVDLLFALLVPEESTNEHLQVLATLAERFSNTELVNRLRWARSAQTLFELLKA